jgi:hypothetical protein
MSCCDETRPCEPDERGLGLVPPSPGQSPLRRRVGEFEAFARDLIARVEGRAAAAGPLGRDWDVEGDPHAALLVELWAYVAEIVAAYSELTAAESYLGTASDWTDLRRLADLVGYRPRPPVAAQGWVRVEVDAGADPLLPEGTRVQAPGTPARASQTFEVAEDTQLRSEWNALTATWVPVATLPEGRRLRFFGDPGFRTGDQVLFVEETPSGAGCGDPPSVATWDADAWIAFWKWLLCLYGISASAQALALASVVSREEELGTTVVEFDRDVESVLSSQTKPYAAYRILESAGQAHHLNRVLRITESSVTPTDVTGSYTQSSAIDGASIVLDAELEGLSQGQTVAIVDWVSSNCDVLPIKNHRPFAWEVAPGTPTRASRIEFDDSPATPGGQPQIPATLDAPFGQLTVYVVDRRIVARHYTFPLSPQGSTQGQLRIYPAPKAEPGQIAVETSVGGKPLWEVLSCKTASAQELPQPGDPPDAPRGLIVDLVDGPPTGALVKARASANLARIRHGTTKRAGLGSGDATRARPRFPLPDAPIAYDLNAAGSLVPSQELRVEGVRWDEVGTLYGRGPAEVFAVRLEQDGGLTVLFGDGEQGASLPTGRNNVTSVYRVGGGLAGEVESGAIDSLLGSVRGVKKVEGAGPTTGGADADDERRLRSLVPARARAFGRAVSIEDLVDLSVGYPGVTHAAAWQGEGPPACSCGGSGLHLAFVRSGTTGPRVPEPAEVAPLGAFLDARRDATVPLCVCAAVLSDPPVKLSVELAVDPRRLTTDVVAAVTAALVDPEGPLGPLNRTLGQPLDRSDVLAVVHGVSGVVGVPSLTVPGAGGELGRRTAARYELIVLDQAPTVGGAPA